MRLRIFAAFCCGLFITMAQAGDGRFPATSVPALTFHTPDDWTRQPVEDGSLVLVSGNRTSSFTLTVGHYPPGSLDDIAARVMSTGGAAPPRNMGSAEISGHRGGLYDSTMTNRGGASVHVHLTVVMSDPNTVTTVTMFTMDGLSAADLKAAQAVLYSMRLVTTP
jgi:hypothetical protein